MKKLILLVTAIGVGISTHSQEVCESFSQMKEGTFLEYTNYDRKGKEVSKSSHTTSEIKKEDGVTTAMVTVTSTDLKNKDNTFTSQYTISCEDQTISIDMMRFFDAERMSQFGENMDVKVDGNAITFPPDATVGKQLDDGYITVSAASGGIAFMTLTMNITNRRVAAEETITTPAGEFDCKKIVYDFESKVGIVKVKGTAEQWYSENQILILSRTKNKKGKDLGDSKLTQLQL